MTVREAAMTLFWPSREHNKLVMDFGLVGSVLGFIVGEVYFSSPTWLFFAVASLGALLGSAAAVVLLICGYGANRPSRAAPQDPNRESVIPKNHP